MNVLPWVAFAAVAAVFLILLAGCCALQSEPRRKDSNAGSVADPKVARMDLKQRAYGKRLRREGRSLLSGKAYKPALTTQQPAKPARTDNVTVLRRAK